MTERVRFLKNQVERMDDKAVFLERVTLLLEAEERYRHLDNGAKYAQSFRHVLEHMTVDVREGELIAGLVPEKLLTPEEESFFRDACERHNFKATHLFSFDPLGIIEITDPDERFAPDWLNSYGHCIPDWERLLKLGLGGIREEIDAKSRESGLSGEQRAFLENARTACAAVSAFILRYAEQAEALSWEAGSEDKERLLAIADNCRSVAERGAETFCAAAQLIWFNMLILHAVCGARDYGYGRMDQYLYPYYTRDLAAGRLTREGAEEILQCLFLKSNEIIGYGWEAYRPKRSLCVNSLQYVMIAGAGADGRDNSNELSFMILDAIDALKLKQPTVNVRWHRGIDPALMDRACRIAAEGLGYPSFFCDDTVKAALTRAGVSQERTAGYCHYGCNNSCLPGLEDELREAWHCLPKYLEYALNSGACMLTGTVQGCVTPDPHRLQSMEEVWDALRAQMADGIAKTLRHVERSDRYWMELKPFGYESVLMSGCVAAASSMNAAGSYQKHINCHASGLATAANSLYALNRLVFEEKRFTLPEFVRLLKRNWAGEELVRLQAARKFPKFGNDCDEVDAVAARLAELFFEELEKASPTATGRKLYPSVYSLWHHRAFGKKCAASADGRFAGEDLSESQSPVYGTDAQGPTALFNSAAKLPLSQTPSGGMNVKFQPRLFAGPEGHLLLKGLIEGYFAKGGMHVQVNVIGRETLEDARLHPEKHRNLLVRVVGYSAYFVSLSPEQQQELIDRSEL